MTAALFLVVVIAVLVVVGVAVSNCAVICLECHRILHIRVVELAPNCSIYVVVRDFTCSCYWPTRALPKTTLDSDAKLRGVAQLIDADRRFQGRPDMAQGTVKFFNSQKGFGFIQPTDGGQDVFVHISAVERAGMSNLNEGQKLTYDVVSERGKLAASNLQNV